ncbi:hypothetical protein [Sphingopyxis sp. 113P3]|jgi:hypothetical protein|uniref:hypothetical protein n=1 Tax=Sphingopyxis sp. (strain 113P3) TaxID=292913 RepID=UPI0006AD556D|nr:hypothetical protein [Sphingopyxis sp. 113P3]ALC10365.1 hypothetical protein LH20_00170 [Sphingopyxis sp. 113P3]
MKSPLAASFGALLLLAGCSGQAQTDTQAPESKTAVDETKLPETGGGEPIELSAIEKGELLRLDGDHECSFTIKGQSGPALVARASTGDDELASGAYKIGGKVLRVAGSGGFKALEKGMELSGPGMKLAVKPGEGGQPATLLAQRTYGGERSFEGAWACKA